MLRSYNPSGCTPPADTSSQREAPGDSQPGMLPELKHPPRMAALFSLSAGNHPILRENMQEKRYSSFHHSGHSHFLMNRKSNQVEYTP